MGVPEGYSRGSSLNSGPFLGVLFIRVPCYTGDPKKGALI